MTQLGEAFMPQVRDGSSGAIESLVRGIVVEVIGDLNLNHAPPVVNVAPSTAKVSGPTIELSPQIVVNERDVDAPTINIDATIPGLEDFDAHLKANTRALEAIHGDIQLLIQTLRMPVTKHVIRGKGGLIDDITEAR